MHVFKLEYIVDIRITFDRLFWRAKGIIEEFDQFSSPS